MEVLIKCAALGLFSSLIALLLRRFHPELSFALTAATLAVILLACGVLLERLMQAARDAVRLFGEPPAQLQSILKCLGIALTSRICSNLCRDASQTALAAAVETAGTLCAAAVAMPAILNLLCMISEML